jgi:hypothetical protein
MFKKATFISTILTLTLLVSSPVVAADHPQNIILFGWDGAQRDHVKGATQLTEAYRRRHSRRY